MSKRGKDDGWSLPHPPGGKKKKKIMVISYPTRQRGERKGKRETRRSSYREETPTDFQRSE